MQVMEDCLNKKKPRLVLRLSTTSAKSMVNLRGLPSPTGVRTVKPLKSQRKVMMRMAISSCMWVRSWTTTGMAKELGLMRMVPYGRASGKVRSSTDQDATTALTATFTKANSRTVCSTDKGNTSTATASPGRASSARTTRSKKKC